MAISVPVFFWNVEPDVEGERREDPKEDNETADNDILLMLIHNAHADEGNWKAE